MGLLLRVSVVLALVLEQCWSCIRELCLKKSVSGDVTEACAGVCRGSIGSATVATREKMALMAVAARFPLSDSALSSYLLPSNSVSCIAFGLVSHCLSCSVAR
eukprot:981240-Rhodomonas_salina.1